MSHLGFVDIRTRGTKKIGDVYLVFLYTRLEFIFSLDYRDCLVLKAYPMGIV